MTQSLYVEAINRALREEMERISKVIIRALGRPRP